MKVHKYFGKESEGVGHILMGASSGLGIFWCSGQFSLVDSAITPKLDSDGNKN